MGIRRVGRGAARDEFLLRLLAAVVVLALVATACSGGDADSDADGESGGDEPEEESDDLVDGPAPARWDEDVAYRVDEVSVEDGALEIVLTVATRAERSLDDSDIRLVTNTGLELPRAEEQERTIPAMSQATLTVRTDALGDEPIRTLELTAFRMDTTVDVPADGERFRWAPAPERQVGFTDGLMRDNSPVAVVPYTFRSDGLISELTFLAVTKNPHNPELCFLECRLEDGGGRTYPWLGSRYEFADARGSRVRGTLRFLGQIPPDETDLRVFIEGSSGYVVTPDPNLEFGFTLPRAEDSELTVAAADTRPEPFDVDTVIDNEAGLQIRLGEMAFFEDRIQLDIEATASGESSWRLNYQGRSRLRDPSGYDHRLASPAGGGDLDVSPGDTLSATLVFLTPLAESADELHLEFALDSDLTFGHTIELPARPTSDDEDDDQDDDEDEEAGR